MEPGEKVFLERWKVKTYELIHSSAKDAGLVEQRQEQIIQGALKLFFEKGYHPTSIAQIAQACGMSMGQLYHYISSKDDILFLVHKHMQISWIQRLMKARVNSIEKPLDRLAYSLRLSFDFLMENSELIKFIYTESKYLNKRHLRVILEMDNEYVVGFWRDRLKEIFGDSSPVDIDLSANFIEYAMIFYQMRGWNIKKTPSNELFAFLLKFIFEGLGLGSPPMQDLG